MVEAKVATTSSNKDENKRDEIVQKDVQELLENDLSCAICQDIYINPLILNCSHSFCKFCVYQWLSKKTGCPQCRLAVSFQAENLALRNIINRMVQKTSTQFQTTRTSSVTQRLKDEEKQESNGTTQMLPWAKKEHISTYNYRPRTTRYRMVQGGVPRRTPGVLRNQNFSLYSINGDVPESVLDGTITIGSDDSDSTTNERRPPAAASNSSERTRPHNWGWSDLSELFYADADDSEDDVDYEATDDDRDDTFAFDTDSESATDRDLNSDSFDRDSLNEDADDDEDEDDEDTDMDVSSDTSDESSDGEVDVVVDVDDDDEEENDDDDDDEDSNLRPVEASESSSSSDSSDVVQVPFGFEWEFESRMSDDSSSSSDEDTDEDDEDDDNDDDDHDESMESDRYSEDTTIEYGTDDSDDSS